MKHFMDVAIHQDDMNKELRSLLKVLKPGWCLDFLTCQTLSGGLLNTVMLYHLSTDPDCSDGVVVKIYGEVRNDMADADGEITSVLSREWEFWGMQVGHSVGCAPEVLAVLNNGIIYKYVRGRRLATSDLTNPVIVRAVARTLADIHCVDISELRLVNRNGRAAKFNPKPRYVSALRQYIAKPPSKLDNPEHDKRYQEVRSRLEEITAECEFIERVVNDLDLHTAVCHNDAHNLNILYDDDTDHVTFVDWELCDFNYTMYDATMFLVQSLYFDVANGILHRDEMTSEKKFWGDWSQSYLRRVEEHRQRNSSSASDSTLCEARIELHEMEFKLFSIMHHLAIVGMEIFYVNSRALTSREVDLTPNMRHSWTTYLSLRPQIENLRQRHKSLTQQLKRNENHL